MGDVRSNAEASMRRATHTYKYRQISQHESWCGVIVKFLAFNNFDTQKSRMDVAQTLQGLSYKVCSTIPQKYVTFGFFTLAFKISTIKDQQLVAKLRGYLRFFYINWETYMV